MGSSIAMLEMGSIAIGMDACDEMLKKSRVELLRASTACPGKFIIIVGGDTSEVQTAVQAGKNLAGKNCFDSMQLANVHKQLMPAIAKKTPITACGAVGVLEYSTISSALLGADIAAKAANILLADIRTGFGIGGKGVVILSGDISAVKAAVAAAIAGSTHLQHNTVIARPAEAFLQSL